MVTDLEKLALMLAIEAPPKQGKYSTDAKVSWGTMTMLRAELDKLGLDWRSPRKEYIRILRQQRAEAYRKRQERI